MHFTVSIHLILSTHSFVKSDLSYFHILANTNMPENMRVQVSLCLIPALQDKNPDIEWGKNPDIDWGNQTVALILIFWDTPVFSPGVTRITFPECTRDSFSPQPQEHLSSVFLFFLNNTHHDRESYNRKLCPLPLMLFLSCILIGHTLKSPTYIVLILGLFLKYFTFGE